MSDILGVEMGDCSGRYLGRLSLIGRRKREILGFIRDKVVGRINRWNSRLLSRAEKEILLKKCDPIYSSVLHERFSDSCGIM